jgi:hypothetical protein
MSRGSMAVVCAISSDRRPEARPNRQGYRSAHGTALLSAPMLRTLGIDLAAQPKDTAYCVVEWVSQMALVKPPVLGATDAALLDEMGHARWTGIDAPFGWPETFVQAVGQYAATAEWPHDATSEALRFRETDRFVRDAIKHERGVSLSPLSVSSNWIAACAWRCAGLLRQHHQRSDRALDRISTPLANGLDGPPDDERASGSVATRGVVEVYPAGALAMWGLPHRGYKTSQRTTAQAARERRDAILAQLESEADGWLELDADSREACLRADHALDALISALVACAAATGETLRADIGQRGAAQREGWIHLPEPNSLARLAPANV